MARKTIFVSDLTGKEIDEKNAAQVVINYRDARRGRVVLDVNADEVDDLASKGTKQARRGVPRSLQSPKLPHRDGTPPLGEDRSSDAVRQL
jgi:hypothetical protein